MQDAGRRRNVAVVSDNSVRDEVHGSVKDALEGNGYFVVVIDFLVVPDNRNILHDKLPRREVHPRSPDTDVQAAAEVLRFIIKPFEEITESELIFLRRSILSINLFTVSDAT